MRILIVILGYIGLYRDKGKQNGSYQTRVWGFRVMNGGIWRIGT